MARGRPPQRRSIVWPIDQHRTLETDLYIWDLMSPPRAAEPIPVGRTYDQLHGRAAGRIERSIVGLLGQRNQHQRAVLDKQFACLNWKWTLRTTEAAHAGELQLPKVHGRHPQKRPQCGQDACQRLEVKEESTQNRLDKPGIDRLHRYPNRAVLFGARWSARSVAVHCAGSGSSVHTSMALICSSLGSLQ